MNSAATISQVRHRGHIESKFRPSSATFPQNRSTNDGSPADNLYSSGSFADIEIHPRRVDERVPAVAGLRAQGLDHTAARGGWLGDRRRRRLGRAGAARREPRPVASALLAPATELSTGSSHEARTATKVPREQRPRSEEHTSELQ